MCVLCRVEDRDSCVSLGLWSLIDDVECRDVSDRRASARAATRVASRGSHVAHVAVASRAIPIEWTLGALRD